MEKNNTCTFGFIGTFSYWHGINVLEAIIPEVCKQNKNAQFLLIGDGVLRKQLEASLQQQGVAEQVLFTGVIPQDQAPQYLAQCDVFLCPTQANSDGTRFFGSPTKLFEYMSMAKPIMASDLEQLAEIINPALRIKELNNNDLKKFQVANQIGILVDPTDIQGFIDACLFCLNLSETERQKMGENARKKVIEQYTWQQHVQRIIKHAGL